MILIAIRTDNNSINNYTRGRICLSLSLSLSRSLSFSLPLSISKSQSPNLNLQISISLFLGLFDDDFQPQVWIADYDLWLEGWDADAWAFTASVTLGGYIDATLRDSNYLWGATFSDGMHLALESAGASGFRVASVDYDEVGGTNSRWRVWRTPAAPLFHHQLRRRRRRSTTTTCEISQWRMAHAVASVGSTRGHRRRRSTATSWGLALVVWRMRSPRLHPLSVATVVTRLPTTRGDDGPRGRGEDVPRRGLGGARRELGRGERVLRARRRLLRRRRPRRHRHARAARLDRRARRLAHVQGASDENNPDLMPLNTNKKLTVDLQIDIYIAVDFAFEVRATVPVVKFTYGSSPKIKKIKIVRETIGGNRENVRVQYVRRALARLRCE